MFGDDNLEDIVTELLYILDFDSLLEMNDLSQEDVLRILIRGGHIGEPESVIEKLDSKSIED